MSRHTHAVWLRNFVSSIVIVMSLHSQALLFSHYETDLGESPHLSLELC